MQGAIAVILLGAFVFGQIWILPILGVLVAAGAAFGPPGSPFHRLFAAYVEPRLPPATDLEAAATIRAQDALATALLAAATVAVLISLNGLAWIIALAEAGVAAVAATTGVHLGVALLDRLRHNRHQ